MKLKKIIGVTGLSIAALLVAGVVLFGATIDSICKTAVETGSTDALGVSTTLKQANLRVLASELNLTGLRVTNPPGFSERPFLSLRDGSVAVSVATVMSDTIELPHLRLSGIELDIERRQGESNYGAILEHMQSQSPANAPPAQTPPAQPSAGANYIIREVTIRDVLVNLSVAPLGGEPTVVTLPIKEITLSDVGADRPLPLSQVAGVIVQAVLSTVVQQGGSLVPSELLNDLSGSLSKLGDLKSIGISVASDLGEETARMIREASTEAVDSAEKAVDDVKKTLKGVGENLPFEKKKSGGG